MDTISAVLGIIVIDLVLSGDNAIVIGMAAHRLPPRQRRLAILGAGVIAWTGTDLVLEDPFVMKAGSLPSELHAVTGVAVTAVVLTLAHLVHRRRPAHRVS